MHEITRTTRMEVRVQIFKRFRRGKTSKYNEYSCGFSPPKTFESYTLLNAICPSYFVHDPYSKLKYRQKIINYTEPSEARAAASAKAHKMRLRNARNQGFAR